MTLDTAQVLALAPDPASAKAGQGLAAVRHWTLLGRNAETLWGLCQGSGKDPYQARVALADLAHGCSCPSRKLPCKHVLGLMLLAAQGSLKDSEPPAFVSEWMAKRLERQEKKQQKAEVERTPEQLEKAAAAAEKRAESRSERRAEGLDELQRWMSDLLRSGLGQAPVTEDSFWENRARRLVDAALPGLARRLQRCYEHAIKRTDWPQAVLREFAYLNLAIEANGRVDAFDGAQRADLERALGVAQGQDQVDTDAAIEDDWLCLGVHVEPLETVTMQRSWWWGGHSTRLALVLNFTPNAVPLQSIGVPGRAERLRLAFYAASQPLRAQFLTRANASAPVLPPAISVAGALERYAHALAADPWLEQYALVIAGRLLLDSKQQLYVIDADAQALPLGAVDAIGWRWLAISRGADYRFAGEWNGERFTLLHGWRA